jgi:acyl carrier protein
MNRKIIQILQEIRPEFEDEFERAIDFFEQGILDSFDLVVLVSALDQEFSISIDGIDIIPENLCSLRAIEKLIEKYGAGL